MTPRLHSLGKMMTGLGLAFVAALSMDTAHSATPGIATVCTILAATGAWMIAPHLRRTATHEQDGISIVAAERPDGIRCRRIDVCRETDATPATLRQPRQPASPLARGLGFAGAQP